MKRVPPSVCPNCGDVHDAATAADGSGAMPEPGDFTICFNCGDINRYDDNMQRLHVDPAALDTFDDETRVAVLDAQRQVKRMKMFNLPMPNDGEDD